MAITINMAIISLQYYIWTVSILAQRLIASMPGCGKHQRLRDAVRLGVLRNPQPGRRSSSGAAASSRGPSGDNLLDDPEVECLVQLWALGLLSAKTLQAIAAASSRAAPRAPIESLAALGNGGRHGGNTHRDLDRRLRLGSCDVAQVCYAELPMVQNDREDEEPVTVNYPFILPHEFLADMFQRHRQEFDHFVCNEALSGFWDEVSSTDPRLASHGVRRVRDDRNRAIPLRLHGDGVPIGRGKKRSLDTISFSSLVASRTEGTSTWDTRFLSAAVVSAAKYEGSKSKPSTMNVAWALLVWSFE